MNADVRDWLVDHLIDGPLVDWETDRLERVDGEDTFQGLIEEWEDESVAKALKALSRSAYKERRKDFMGDVKSKLKSRTMAAV